MRHLALSLALLHAGLAAAHEGHGPSNPHWHASDLFGVALVVGLIAVALWKRRK